MFTLTRHVLLVGVVLSLAGCEPEVDVHVCFDPDHAPVGHAASKIVQALAERGQSADTCTLEDIPDDAWTLVLETTDGDLPADAFSVKRATDPTNRLDIRGSTPRGVLYGGLAVAEDIRNGRFLVQIEDRREEPAFRQRAVAFDPEGGDLADMEFWSRFLDMMARNRFNALVLPEASDSVRALAFRRGIDMVEGRVGIAGPGVAARPFVLRWGVDESIRSMLRGARADGIEAYAIQSGVSIAEPVELATGLMYVFENHWLFYKLWGRLLYNPHVSDDVFQAELDNRYGIAGATLLNAHGLAGEMAIHIARLLDPGPEGTVIPDAMAIATLADTLRPVTVDDVINSMSTDPAYVSIRDYVGASQAGRVFTPDQITPHELADKLESDARRALVLVESIEAVGRPALQAEVGDIRAWSYLSLYLAEKIRGGVAMYKYRNTGLANLGELAIQRLEKGADYWDELVAVAEPLHGEVSITGLNGMDGLSFSWERVTEFVRAEVATPGQ